MTNLMTNIYIGYVEEIMYKNGRPTLELRVRVPSMHGANDGSGLKRSELPIAKPIITPGVGFNETQLVEELQAINKVYVMFESGNHENLVYFGVKGNESLYTIPSFSSTCARSSVTFAQVEDPTLNNEVFDGDLWFDTSVN
jgi:hypothetical protein